MRPNNLFEMLNKNLANLKVLYVKLHNYHWNVKGMYFKPIHEMTEAYYNYLAGKYDEVAERIVQLGEKPLVTLKDYLTNASLEEEDKNEFDAKYVLSSIRSDFEQLNGNFKEISKAAVENRDASGDSSAGPDSIFAPDKKNNVLWAKL